MPRPRVSCRFQKQKPNPPRTLPQRTRFPPFGRRRQAPPAHRGSSFPRPSGRLQQRSSGGGRRGTGRGGRGRRTAGRLPPALPPFLVRPPQGAGRSPRARRARRLGRAGPGKRGGALAGARRVAAAFGNAPSRACPRRQSPPEAPAPPLAVKASPGRGVPRPWGRRRPW